MNYSVFKNHQDWLMCLSETPIEQVLHRLIQQLEKNFSEALLDKNLIASLDPLILAEQQLIPLCFYQQTLYLAHSAPSVEQQLQFEHIFGCSVSLLPCCFEHYPLDFKTSPLSPVPIKLEPSVSDTFQELLCHAREVRASDVHLEPQQDQSILVRFRVDGLLHDIQTLHSFDFDYSRRMISKIKVAAELDIAETRVPQDGRITEIIQSEPVDLRVSTLPSLHGEKIVIRLLPHKNPFQELRDLGFEGEALLTYYSWIKKPQGMVLITGQTGSGKTSTLYTTLSHLLNAEKNVVTIEDPIEYQLKGATQVQVHPKVGLTFANGLRSILRQDPDTILLGEIRDAETAEIAYQAALTGHMVLSTLHTNDAPSAIIRLMDIQVEPYLIASATLGVVAQRLIRRVCSQCVQSYTPAQDLLRSLGLESKRQEYTFSKAIGCEHCFHTGYYGREGIFEVMPVDNTLAALISQKKDLTQIRDHLQSQKIQSLFDAAIGKVERGLTTVEEVYRIVPPTQHNHRNRTSGSVFVFMLFLISILSILILNMSSLFEGKTSLLHMQNQSMQGQYANFAALQVGKSILFEKLNLDHLYWTPKRNKSNNSDPLKQVSELQTLFNQTQTLAIGTGMTTQYQIQTTLKSNPQPGLFHYQYQIQGQTSANHLVCPPQLFVGNFQIESGPLPLSFFERFAATGLILDAPTNRNLGPWYSPQKPESKSIPLHGYLTQSINLAQILWPVIGDATLENSVTSPNPGAGLTPISAGYGATLWLAQKQEQPNAFDPSKNQFALSVYGKVDRLVLNAPNTNSQTIELNQLSPVQSIQPDANGYQKQNLLKTTLEESLLSRIFKVTTQQLELTLNPQKNIINQKVIQTTTEYFPGNFSGLILIYGSVSQLVSKDTSGNNAYSRPLTFFANTDIGMPNALLHTVNSDKALLGLISQDGFIRFQPLEEPPISDWKATKNTAIQLEAALAATDYQIPQNTDVVIKGSVANIKGTFPPGLKTESDARFHHIAIAPPYYPKVNPDALAVLVTQAPSREHWQEKRDP